VRFDAESRAERALLILCLALPQLGDGVLAAADLDALIRSDDLRRAARHLIGRCAAPLCDLPDGDDALAATLRDLVTRAARADGVTPQRIEHARLVLERQRLERAIRRARAERRSGIGELAREREGVLAAIHRVVGEIEKAG
jgi:hypothetical protein